MIDRPAPCDYPFVAGADSVGTHPLLGAATGHADSDAPVPAAPAGPLGLRDLFEQYHGSIWRLLRRLGVDVDQLDDAAQEVFWVAARRLGDIRVGSEHAFLYGVALRVASNTHRRQKCIPPMTTLDAAAAAADRGPSPEEACEQQSARALLDAVLEQMPGELRTIFVLSELEELTTKTIAELEGIPLGTAASRLRRAREEFSAIARRVRAQLLRGGNST